MNPITEPKTPKRPKKAKRSRVSLRWKLLFAFGLYAAIILTVLWLCQVVFLDAIYKGIKEAEIKSAAKDLVKITDRDDLSSRAEAVCEDKQICLRVFEMREDGQTAAQIADIDIGQRCVIHHMSKDGIFQLYDFAHKEGGTLLQRYRYNLDKRVYYEVHGGPLDRSQDEESIVLTVISGDRLFLFNSVTSPVASTVRTINLLLIAISVLLIILAVLLTLILSRRIAKPLEGMNESAKRLAGGDYGTDFSGAGCRELSELGDSLNYAASELSKTDSLRRDLIANVSHDLRTPLTLISGYAEMMRDIPGENTPENDQIIIDETARLTALVNDMLDLSKLQSGTQTLSFTVCNLTALLSSALGRYNKLIEQRGCRVIFAPEFDAMVSTDVTRFQQVFFNLINNALTHTGEDRTVTVTQTLLSDPVTSAPARVRISVTDSGEGIPEDKLDLIWDRYYKVDKLHKRGALGSGLGLSIVKTTMEQLGGTYGVFSRVGEGSTFYVELPLCPPPDPDSL